MEEDPFAVLESMTIAGYATGCERGYLYVRGEYPLAARRLSRAIEAARTRGLLGTDVLGLGFAFDVELRRGAGAYICGEETALFNSIEGFRGEPRNKPPFPVVSGLFGKPTVINNVETLVNVPFIVREAGPKFAATGTAQSTGTKLFCVSGNVSLPGLYEVPFGETLAQLLERAGGVPRGRRLQAVLLGGAAGGFVTPEEIHAPLTFEGLRAIGATSARESSWSSTTRRTCATRSCASPRSSATSRAVSACRAAWEPCARRRRSTGSPAVNRSAPWRRRLACSRSSPRSCAMPRSAASDRPPRARS